MLVLAIQTAIQPYAIALLEDGRVVKQIQLHADYAFSEDLMVHISELVGDFTQLDRICVANGPGGYTGLRLGVSVAKTIGVVHEIPVVGVSSLEAQARKGPSKKTLCFSILPARKNELNCQVFSTIDGEFKRVSDMYSQSESDFLKKIESIEGDVLICGPFSFATHFVQVDAVDVARRGMECSPGHVKVVYSHLPLLGKKVS